MFVISQVICEHQEKNAYFCVPISCPLTLQDVRVDQLGESANEQKDLGNCRLIRVNEKEFSFYSNERFVTS